MKNKDLIKKLQELDPEMEVVVNDDKSWLEPDKKQFLVRFTFASDEKTLSKEEVDLEMNKIIEELEKEGIQIRK